MTPSSVKPSPTKRKTKKKKKKTSSKRSLRWSDDALLSTALSLTEENGGDLFADWATHLTSRKRPSKTKKILGTNILPALTWSIPRSVLAETCLSPIFLKLRKRASEKAASKGRSGTQKAKWKKLISLTSDAIGEGWLQGLAEGSVSAAVGLEALAWCQLLPESTKTLSRETWIRIFDALCDLATNEHTSQHPLADQLLAVELPLALAWQFPESDRCSLLADRAASRLSSNIVNLLDGQGMILGNHFGEFGSIAACWTRCRAMMRELRGVKLSKPAASEYDWMVRNLLRLVQPDGQLFTSLQSEPHSAVDSDNLTGAISPVIRAALNLTEDDEDIALAKLRLEGKKISASRLPDAPAFHSEWSGVAVLQPNWKTDSPRLSVNFSEQQMHVEATVAGRVLFSSNWQPEIVVDGKTLAPVHAKEKWESTCWFSDDESDYLETEIELAGDWRIQRQFLMTRRSNLLFTADNLIRRKNYQGPLAKQIEYRLTLPVSPGLSIRAEKETREQTLKAKKNVAMLMPLGLPEWKSESRDGEFGVRDGAIRLIQTGQGGGLNAPLVFDLDPKRFRLPRTWRSLTVAATRKIIPPDEAVGYRIQIGPEQWLVYRSLTETGNRTLIGHNLASDFLFARLTTDGVAETLIEIE